MRLDLQPLWMGSQSSRSEQPLILKFPVTRLILSKNLAKFSFVMSLGTYEPGHVPNAVWALPKNGAKQQFTKLPNNTLEIVAS